MDRCPNCGTRSDGGARCRRCEMDLTLLCAAEQAAEQLLRRGITHLAAAELKAAVAVLTRAQGLTGDPFVGHLLAFAQAEQRAALGGHLLAIAQALGCDQDIQLPLASLPAGPIPEA